MRRGRCEGVSGYPIHWKWSSVSAFSDQIGLHAGTHYEGLPMRKAFHSIEIRFTMAKFKLEGLNYIAASISHISTLQDIPPLELPVQEEAIGQRSTEIPCAFSRRLE